MLTLQFIPHDEISTLSSESKVKKLINLVKDEKILLIEGRLDPGEEAKLIEKTMEQIDKKFSGIEICTVYPKKENTQFLDILKAGLASLLLGHKQGMTVIGPASIIKEIKKNPNKIELFTVEKRNKR